MNSHATGRFWELNNQLPDDIRRAADTSYHLWRRNLGRPSRQFKRVHTKRPVWSVRITEGWRTTGVRDDDTLIGFWIGTPDEYERMPSQL